MSSRAKSICRKAGCNALISAPGYCENHIEMANPFRTLDSKKTPETKRFYSSGAWTRTSLKQRREMPLCAECLEKGLTKKGELVHHDPPLEVLLSKGLSPLDKQYLITLCHNCHQGHLRAKRL